MTYSGSLQLKYGKPVQDQLKLWLVLLAAQRRHRLLLHRDIGMRRLELFGEDHNIWPGWVTVGSSLTSSNFNPQAHLHTLRPFGTFRTKFAVVFDEMLTLGGE
ncbi:hypothetical protein ABBQ38_006772 [Trebouxia sp. C0009 RCD-2024]